MFLLDEYLGAKGVLKKFKESGQNVNQTYRH
jgi:hypothetical protein